MIINQGRKMSAESKIVANFIENIYREISSIITPEYIELYQSFQNQRLQEILSTVHAALVLSFKAMNQRLPTKNYEAHFWAANSRDLMMYIDIVKRLQRGLKDSPLSINIDKYYDDIINICDSFLQQTGGSVIPVGMDRIELYYTIPIFTPADQTQVKVAIEKIPFDAGYIKTQIDRMEKSIDSDPDLVIGTAKELVETCLKEIIGTDSNDDMPKLLRTAMDSMNLLPTSVSENAKGAEQIKKLLGSLFTIVVNMAELRNLYGTGHGQMKHKSSLEPRHARLAMGAAATFVNFVFETYAKHKNAKK